MLLIVVHVLTIHVLRYLLLNIKNVVKDVLYSFQSVPNQMIYIKSMLSYMYNINKSLFHCDNQKQSLNNYNTGNHDIFSILHTEKANMN